MQIRYKLVDNNVAIEHTNLRCVFKIHNRNVWVLERCRVSAFGFHLSAKMAEAREEGHDFLSGQEKDSIRDPCYTCDSVPSARALIRCVFVKTDFSKASLEARFGQSSEKYFTATRFPSESNRRMFLINGADTCSEKIEENSFSKNCIAVTFTRQTSKTPSPNSASAPRHGHQT